MLTEDTVGFDWLEFVEVENGTPILCDEKPSLSCLFLSS